MTDAPRAGPSVIVKARQYLKPIPPSSQRSDGWSDSTGFCSCGRPRAARHIVQGVFAECILPRRRRNLVRRAVLEAFTRLGLPYRIRVLPIGHIQSPSFINADRGQPDVETLHSTHVRSSRNGAKRTCLYQRDRPFSDRCAAAEVTSSSRRRLRCLLAPLESTERPPSAA